MKKSLAIKLLSALLIIILIFSLGGCCNEDIDEDNFALSGKTEIKIRETLLANSKNDNITISDIVIKHYLGNYQG